MILFLSDNSRFGYKYHNISVLGLQWNNTELLWGGEVSSKIYHIIYDYDCEEHDYHDYHLYDNYYDVILNRKHQKSEDYKRRWC